MKKNTLLSVLAIATVIIALIGYNSLLKGTAPDADADNAVQPDREAITYFGRMILLDHEGPRGQIHLQDGTILWFPSVRDLFAYYMDPAEEYPIESLYVTDMANGADWAKPQNWMHAKNALYVIESSRVGGMGALEAVPFSNREDAKDFIDNYGGKIVAFKQVNHAYIFAEPNPKSKNSMDKDSMHKN